MSWRRSVRLTLLGIAFAAVCQGLYTSTGELVWMSRCLPRGTEDVGETDLPEALADKWLDDGQVGDNN